ncbi:hypothetical protein MMC20_007378 [Loxospora ochrophaea]|nr:hypothetical protein [Loxospora ochrophaea]
MDLGTSSSSTNARFTHSQRIQQLNAIDKDVAKLLHSAGSAFKALTNQKSATSDGVAQESSLFEQQQESFARATAKYFSLLSSIDVQVRRQIYALEEADIIPSDAVSKESVPSLNSAASALSQKPSNTTLSGEKTFNFTGTLGNLDIGWLNSRNDRVGREMELELWMQARNYLGGVEPTKTAETEVSDVDMGNGEAATILNP